MRIRSRVLLLVRLSLFYLPIFIGVSCDNSIILPCDWETLPEMLFDMKRSREAGLLRLFIRHKDAVVTLNWSQCEQAHAR